MMDCLRAQEILSAAVDDASMAESLVREARGHCATCPECAAFVRGLELLSAAHAPEPGPALTERLVARVMGVVEAEVSEHGEHATPETRPDERERVRPAIAKGRAARTGRQPGPTHGRLPWLREQRALNVAAWAGAAAVLLVVAGFAAVTGVRSMLAPQTESTKLVPGARDTLTAETYGRGVASPGSAAGTGAAQSADAAPAAPASPGFIALGGSAYRYLGSSEVDRSTLTTAGSTSTALDTGGDQKSYVVYATSTPGRVALVSPGGTRVFELVTRQLGGRTFVLSAESLTTFGEWPSVPSSFTPPTTSDGAPTFVPAGSDDLGVPVFVRPGSRPQDGFAIAPGSPTSDPAAGSPNWTWWVVPRQ